MCLSEDTVQADMKKAPERMERKRRSALPPVSAFAPQRLSGSGLRTCNAALRRTGSPVGVSPMEGSSHNVLSYILLYYIMGKTVKPAQTTPPALKRQGALIFGSAPHFQLYCDYILLGKQLLCHHNKTAP